MSSKIISNELQLQDIQLIVEDGAKVEISSDVAYRSFPIGEVDGLV